jgi:hypothetical protein
MNRFSLEYPEARPDKLLEAEIIRNLKGVLCLVKDPGAVQGKYPGLISHIAKAD